MAKQKSIKVLFVCLGNICRSPMAEFMFKDLVNKNGLKNLFEINSKGTSSYETGNDTYYGTKDILDLKNIKYTKRKASRITKEDFINYDYIIGMDNKNIRSLINMAPTNTKHKIYLLLDIDKNTEGQIVPDPWYTRDFDETYNLLNNSLKLWLDKMIEENNL